MLLGYHGAKSARAFSILLVSLYVCFAILPGVNIAIASNTSL